MAAERRFPGWIRYSGVGLELAGATAGLALVGRWVDGHFGTSPWGTLVGVGVGLVGGLYNLVKESLQAVRDGQDEDREARHERSGAADEPNADGE